MAAPYKLRGIAQKQKFVREYRVRCLWHSILSPEEKAWCCCGESLEGEYYLFSFEKGEQSGEFYAGPGCGVDLNEENKKLGYVEVSRCFDPYGLGVQKPGNIAESGVGGKGVVSVAQANSEMITAISLLLHFWKKKEGPLLSAREALIRDSQLPPTNKAIRMLNKAACSTCGYHLGVRSLRQLLEMQCEKKGVPGRQFQFPILERCIKELNEISYL